MDLKEEQSIGGDPQNHWYYISKGRAIKQLLGDEPRRSILDVGAGSGVFSKFLLECGAAETAQCVDPNYTDAFIEENRKPGIDFSRSVDETAADLVLMMDVIEHVDDDVGLIRQYKNLVPGGAEFLITVPAFNFLWSSHDDFLEHRRRYTLATLTAAVEAAGLEVADTRYFFGMLFPAVAALRLVDRAMKGEREASQSALKEVPGWLSRTLTTVNDVERAVLFPFNRIAGVTAICLARKNTHVAAGEKAA